MWTLTRAVVHSIALAYSQREYDIVLVLPVQFCAWRIVIDRIPENWSDLVYIPAKALPKCAVEVHRRVIRSDTR